MQKPLRNNRKNKYLLFWEVIMGYESFQFELTSSTFTKTYSCHTTIRAANMSKM
jgi:hypothetical protein